MYGFAMAGPLDPVVGEYWVENSNQKKFLLDTKSSDGLYHLVGDGGYDRGWYTKEQLLKHFAKWIDPDASLKAYAKKHGYIWKDKI